MKPRMKTTLWVIGAIAAGLAAGYVVLWITGVVSFMYLLRNF